MEPREIARRRTDLGLSLAALAREIGVDRATVHRWEVGKSRPRGAASTALALTFARLERNQARRVTRRVSATPTARYSPPTNGPGDA